MAGGLHQHIPFWSTILEGSSKQAEILSYIRDGVDVHSFFQPFRGHYQNNDYDHPIPPSVVFKNNASCKGFEDFITSTILSRVCNGSLVTLGKVGEVPSPHLVMPLTVEPSKPRLCHDERFLNIWIKDLPILFGWKTSAYLYHTIGILSGSLLPNILMTGIWANSRFKETPVVDSHHHLSLYSLNPPLTSCAIFLQYTPLLFHWIEEINSDSPACSPLFGSPRRLIQPSLFLTG